MNVCTKCYTDSSSGFRVFRQISENFDPPGGATGKPTGSPGSEGFILQALWTRETNSFTMPTYTVGVRTSGFKLVVLLGLEDRVGDPQPGMMLPQLGDQVVRDKAHRPRQGVQHDGHKGLGTKWYVMEETGRRMNNSKKCNGDRT